MNNEEATIAEFDEAIAALTSDIYAAIKRSISHDEKVSVHIDASAVDMYDAVKIIANLVSEYDTVRENNGSEDVWGTLTEGEDFRLNLYTA